MKKHILIQFLLILCLSCTDKEHESVTTQERLPKTTIINKNNEIFSAFPSFEIFNGTYKARFFTRLNSSHIDTLGGEVIKYSLDSGNNWFIKSEQIVNGIKGFKKPFFNTYPIGWKYIDKIHKDSLLNEGFTVLDLDSSSNLVAYMSRDLIKVKFNDEGVEVQDTIRGPDFMSGIIGLPNFTGHLKKDNILLMSIYGKRYGSNLDEPLIMRSVDNGTNWSFVPILNEIPLNIGFNEVAIEVNSEGNILALMRSTSNDYLYQSTSYDNGLSWTLPHKTNILGYPASIIKLDSGNLLCTYGYRNEPIGIRASVSNDDGLTWEVDNEFIIRKDGFGYGANTGYPQSIEYEYGKIATVYYITDSTNVTSVEMTKWEIK